MDLEQQLKDMPVRYGIRTGYFRETGSTNDDIRNGNYGHGDILVAGRQTKGRGQRGNSWQSEEGENLTFSIMLRPVFLPAGMQFLLSEAVALGITDALGLSGFEPSIKWTNDIYIGDRKVAGVLIENDIMGANLSQSIVGIGLNVNQSHFPEDLPNPVSLKQLAGYGFDRGEVLDNIYRLIMARYTLLEEGHVDAISADYHRRLYLLGVQHLFRLPDGSRFTGTIREVRPTGELMVDNEHGILKGYLFREIEFR